MRRTAFLCFCFGCQDYDVQRISFRDAYTQGEPDFPTDILWVVDNSTTMTEEQELIATHFDAFAEVLQQSASDFQLGVTSTDIDEHGGALVGEVLTPQTPDLAAAFAEQANLGIQGSRDEQPLEAMRLATSEPLLSGDNAGLLRDEAALQVIVLTDEDDHSRDEVDDYLDHLLDLFGSDRVRISAISGPMPAGCISATANAEEAERLQIAVEATGGDLKSICEDDFEPVMTSLALGVNGMTDTFQLSGLPDLSTLEFRVDGVLIHQRAEDGWSYLAADNAIVTNGNAIPRPGQEVDVEYFELVGD